MKLTALGLDTVYVFLLKQSEDFLSLIYMYFLLNFHKLFDAIFVMKKGFKIKTDRY